MNLLDSLTKSSCLRMIVRAGIQRRMQKWNAFNFEVIGKEKREERAKDARFPRDRRTPEFIILSTRLDKKPSLATGTTSFVSHLAGSRDPGGKIRFIEPRVVVLKSKEK